MIEVNTQQAKREFSNLLSEVKSQGTTVKIFDGEKIVAELVPSRAGIYRAQSETHPYDDARAGEYAYRTMGETLKRGEK